MSARPRLASTPSSTSWQLNYGSLKDDSNEASSEKALQRRIEQLTSIQIRNITLNPIRDHLSSALLSHSFVSPTTSRSSFAADDTDLYLRTRRRRAKSSASNTSTSIRVQPLEWHELEREKAEVAASDDSSAVASGSHAMEKAKSSGSISNRSLRRSSNGRRRAGDGIEEEVEFADADHPEAASLSSSSQHESTFDSATTPSLTFSYMRRRSTSRASATSLASNHSGSTIRPHSILTPSHEPSSSYSATKPLAFEIPGRTSYASESAAAKDKQRRVSTLKRRLVDSYITLSLAPAAAASSSSSSVEALLSPESTTIGSWQSPMLRSRSSSSLHRTTRPRSSSGVSAKGKGKERDSIPPHSTSTANPTRFPAFYRSQPQLGTLYPSFNIDSTDFLIEDPLPWLGHRERKMIVEVWIRSEKDNLQNVDGTAISPGKHGEGEWKSLLMLDVDLDELVSIGRNPLLFPALPPNSLIFALSDEYFTISIPLSPARSCFSGEEDSGNQSDPGLSNPATANGSSRHEVDLRVEARTVRDKKMVESADMELIQSLIEVRRLVRECQESANKIRAELDVFYANEDEFAYMDREKEELADRISDFSLVHEELTMDYEDAQAEIKARKEAIKNRRDRLTAAQTLDEQNLIEIDETESGMAIDDRFCKTILKAANDRRTYLITALSCIVPISPYSDSPSSLLFSILDLPLPNSSYPDSFSDETLSSALGYTAQVTEILAVYMSVPLHYPINCMGSRSTVLDMISVMSGPRAFPLYGKGVERYRFDYGVFLLNKNIEQLMYSQNLIVLDLRNTLPNLKMLILSLSYDPSHSSFNSTFFTVAPPMLESISGSSGDVITASPKAQSQRSVSPSPTLKELPLNSSTMAGDVGKDLRDSVEKMAAMTIGKAKSIRTRLSRSNSRSDAVIT